MKRPTGLLLNALLSGLFVLLLLGFANATAVGPQEGTSQAATESVFAPQSSVVLEQGYSTTDAGVKWSPDALYAPHRVIVKFRADAVPGYEQTREINERLPAALVSQGVQEIRPLFPEAALRGQGSEEIEREDELTQIYRVTLSSEASVEAAVAALNDDSAVIWAEPDYLVQAAIFPDDPYYFQQWALDHIGAPAAWDITQGSDSMIIAVLDTGIDLDHPDLVNRLWQNPGEIPDNGVDDDNNDYIDDIHGWNFVEGNVLPQDDVGHGTHVAGIIAAEVNNGIGTAGIDWHARILPLRVLDTNGAGTYSDVAAAIHYAIEKGAQVINMSFGAYATSSMLQETVSYAAENALLVAAAGNNNQVRPFYPAAYPEVIAVGSTDASDAKSAFSSYGPWVDITAPGEMIWSTTFDNGFVGWSGTSMAAPLVAGAASLVRSYFPELSPSALRWHLLNTTFPVDDLNPAYGGQLGRGRLDLSAALNTMPRPQVAISSYAIDGIPSGKPEPGSTATMTVTLANTWADSSNVTAELATEHPGVIITDNNAHFGDIPGGGQAVNDTPFSFILSTSIPFNAPITFTLRLSDSSAYSTTLPVTVTTATNLQNISSLTVDEDTTWENGRQYIIGGQVRVMEGATLTIEPGVVMLFGANGSMVVSGTLHADGSMLAPIRFIPVGNEPWGGLTFAAGDAASVDSSGHYSGGSLLRHVDVLGASTGISVMAGAPSITSSAFISNETALTGFGDLFLFDSQFSNNGSAIICTQCKGYVRGNNFDNNGIALTVTDFGGQVEGNTFRNNGSGLILTGSESSVVSGNLFSENVIGASLSPGWPNAYLDNPDSTYVPGAGTYLVVWEEEAGEDVDLFVQALDAEGGLNSAKQQLTTGGKNSQPRLACDNTGSCLLVYSVTQDNGVSQLVAQALDAGGSPQGPLQTVATYTGALRNFAVAANGITGGYMVAWNDAISGDYDVHVRPVSSTGEVTGTENVVTTDTFDQLDVAVAYNPVSAEFLVVWAADMGLYSGWDLFGSRVSSDNGLASAPFLVSGATGDQRHPAATSETTLGWYTIVWNDGRNGSRDIYGRRLTSSGSLYGNDVQIFAPETPVSSVPSYPQIVYNGVAHEHLVVWNDTLVTSTISGQRLTVNGPLTALGPRLSISQREEEQTGPIAVFHNDSNEYLVLWERLDSADMSTMLYGQRLDAYGAPLDNPQTLRDESQPGANFPLISATRFTHNTLIANDTGVTIELPESDLIHTQQNNLVRNHLANAVSNGAQALNLSRNYWGVTDTTAISATISGSAVISPILSIPDTDAPALLWRLFFASDSAPTPVLGEADIAYGPVGAEMLTFTLDFSRPMDTRETPEVTIGNGSAAGYTPTHRVTSGQWISATRWAGTFQVDWYTGDGIKRVALEGAIDAEGFAIPDDRRYTFEVSILAASAAAAQAGWNEVSLSWQKAADLDTLAGYRVYRATSQGGPYTRLTPVLLAETSYSDHDVVNGTTYYYVVRVVNTALQELDLTEEVAATPSDITAPSRPVVVDGGSCTPYRDRLFGSWSAMDPESGIAAYQYSMGTSPGGSQVVNWTAAGTATEITRSGLQLNEGLTYYINVRAQNGAGAWSAVGSSDGILVSGDCPVARFTAAPTEGPAPLTVVFTDTSLGRVDSWAWDFGDGATSNSANPSHKYETIGRYTVTLRVSGSYGEDQLVKDHYIIVTESGYNLFLPRIVR